MGRDREDKYSTNGGYLVLAGPNSQFPLAWVSKKQTSCSRSTTESEVVALAHSLFLEALPMLSLWDRLVAPASGRRMRLRIHEDNQAAKDIVEAGFSAKLCHISRTHGVNLTSVKDEIDKPEYELRKIHTSKQAADVFTKAVEPQKWGAALDMLGIEREPLPRKGAPKTTPSNADLQPQGAQGTVGAAKQPPGAPKDEKPPATYCMAEGQPQGVPWVSDVDEAGLLAMATSAVTLSPKEASEEWGEGDDDTYDVIGDTGAGAAIGSLKAMEQQGGNTDQIRKRVRPLDAPLRFNTANGIISSTEGIEMKTQGAGSTTMHLLQECPLALSVGEEVSKGHAFVWMPKVKPWFANAKYVKVSCPKSRRNEAAYVKSNVPHFKVRLTEARDEQPEGAPANSRSGGSHFYRRKRGGTRASYVHSDRDP